MAIAKGCIEDPLGWRVDDAEARLAGPHQGHVDREFRPVGDELSRAIKWIDQEEVHTAPSNVRYAAGRHGFLRNNRDVRCHLCQRRQQHRLRLFIGCRDRRAVGLGHHLRAGPEVTHLHARGGEHGRQQRISQRCRRHRLHHVSRPLECFRAKCAAVFPKEARPNKVLGSFIDFAKSGTTLVRCAADYFTIRKAILTPC